ncbi:hypothetical protein ACFYSF_22815 [Streptomyces canus]|uniref:hypothetical protein n=1 Tax=Streptomyces canus TaxID=58343 RepID=UPI0036CF4072
MILSEEDSDLIWRAIVAAGAGHSARAAELTAKLTLQNTDLFSVISGVAEFGARAVCALNCDSNVPAPPGGPWTIDHIRPHVTAEAPDPALDFAEQFLAAHCAGDEPVAEGLYVAMRCLGDRHAVRSLAHLMYLVAEATKTAMAHHMAAGGRPA